MLKASSKPKGANGGNPSWDGIEVKIEDRDFRLWLLYLFVQQGKTEDLLQDLRNIHLENINELKDELGIFAHYRAQSEVVKKYLDAMFVELKELKNRRKEEIDGYPV